MFEKEIQFITDFTLNKVRTLGPSFTLEKLMDTDIHPAILKYISAEFDYMIFDERKKLLQKSLFDYSGTEISKYFKLIGDEIKRTKRVSYDEIKNLIGKGVVFNFRFLIHPNQTLMELTFLEMETRPADEITVLLGYLYYYDHLAEIISSYLSKKKILSLSTGEFNFLLSKIDSELFSDQTEELVDNALNSIAEFFNVGGTGSTKISPAAVEIFLNEKNLTDYLGRLKKAFPSEAKQKYEVEEIRNILYSTTPIAAIAKEEKALQEEHSQEIPLHPDELFEQKAHQPSAEKEEKKQEAEDLKESPEEVYPSAEIEKELEAEKNEVNQEEIAAEEFSIKRNQPSAEIIEAPEEKILKEEPSKKVKGNEESEIKSDKDEVEFDLSEKENLDTLYDFNDVNEKKESSKKGKNESASIGEEEEIHLEIEEETVAAKLDNPEFELDEEVEKKPKKKKKKFKKDIFDFISNKEIDKITDGVFNEDEDDFTNTMERITECSNYDDATEILKKVFRTYKVNPYSKEALALTNAVANYFNQD